MLLSWWSVVIALMWVNTFVSGGEIVSGPSNQTVAIGSTVTLQCKVNISVEDEVLWLRNDVLLFTDRRFNQGAIGDGDRFQVVGNANDYNLRIDRIASSDADYMYTCKIRPLLGTRTPGKSAYIIVHRAPSNQLDCKINRKEPTPAMMTNTVGDLVTFQCESDKGFPYPTLEWADNNGIINSSLDDSITVLTRYFIRVLTVDDNGQSFTCNSMYTSSIVENQTDSCSIGPINVRYPLTNIELIPSSNIDEEGNVDFGKIGIITCSASGGNPLPTKYNLTTSPPIPSERYQINRGVFTLFKVEEADQGLTVQCLATNDVGQGEGLRTNFTLNVTNIPPPTTPTEPWTPPAMISKTKGPLTVMSFPTSYTIIVILVALVVLLGTVCCVLFLVNRRSPPKDAVPLPHMQMSVGSENSRGSMSYARQNSTDTMLDDDDDCSLKKEKCCNAAESPCMERRTMGHLEESKLQNLETGQFRSQKNVYGDRVGQPEIRRTPSPDLPDDLRKPGRRKQSRDSPDSGCSYGSNNSRQCRTATPSAGGGGPRNPERTRRHKKLKPTNSTGPDWPCEKPREKYSPLARRYYSPSQEQLNTPSTPGSYYNTVGASPRPRRSTQSDLEQYNTKPKKGHRRHRSHGSDPNRVDLSPNSRLSPPIEYHQHAHTPSPVMQRKNRREGTDDAAHHQRQQRRSPNRHTGGSSPRSASPRSSPNASPQHPPNRNRPLPDPGLNGSNENVLIDIEAGSDSSTPVMYRKYYHDNERLPKTYTSSSQDDEEEFSYDENYDEFEDDDSNSSDI